MNNLSEFIQEVKEIRRNDKGEAELIMDYVDEGPVRLIGFACMSTLSDFEILEEGYNYWQRLCAEVEKIKDKRDDS